MSLELPPSDADIRGSASEPQAQDGFTPMSEPVNPRKMRILVIDDRPTVITALDYVLGTDFGYEVLTAADGISGLTTAARELPDLVLLDFDMPVFNGLQVLNGLRIEAATKSIPVIVMTGRPSKEVRELSLSAGAREIISKPFDLDSLKATIARHLPQKAA